MNFITRKVQEHFLRSCEDIKHGTLRIKTPEGHLHEFGEGAPEVEFHIKDWSVVTAMASKGDVGLGETYVAGLWEANSIADLTWIGLRNLNEFSNYIMLDGWSKFKYNLIHRFFRANSLAGSSTNIKKHYDVGNEFFQLWLDKSMTYSSALFSGGQEDLQSGQSNKYHRIINRLTDRDDVLEIGCGWGGFAESAADQGKFVTGVTISPSQKGYADARLDGRADIKLLDYRAVEGKHSNIVSIEMIEAVGERYWPTYFNMLKSRLADAGKIMLQAITVRDDYFSTYRQQTDYIRRYTFPGGMLLSPQIIENQSKSVGLQVVDRYDFGHDYAKTCKMWVDRLNDQKDKIFQLGFNETFFRSWQFYLEICAGSFSAEHTNVHQFEICHS